MGCCISSPYNSRVYADPSVYADGKDLDEEEAGPIRYFGANRCAANLVPNDIPGIENTWIKDHLASNADTVLYEAEMDHGWAFRCCRPMWWIALIPVFWPLLLAMIAAQGLGAACGYFSCDQVCCWLRKEYSTRHFMRVYANRIEVNYPTVRFPFGYLGCGSWNSDLVQTHAFDRGAFGFSKVHCCTLKHLLCMFPIYGGVVARHRCQCGGPLWNRMFSDCGGWWCDEWLCKSLFCVYPYGGLANPDEVAFACSIALQAYFEGRPLTPEDLEKCLEFWRENVSEVEKPELKREACCEPCAIPCFSCNCMYRCTHPKRKIPYPDDHVTDRTREAYEKYEKESAVQIARYQKISKTQYSTICRAMGCRRCFGRNGVIFCTEGCNHCDRKAGEPFPPPQDHEFEDDFDASTVLLKVVGPPPPNVVIRRPRYDPEKNDYYLDTYPENEKVSFEEHDSNVRSRVGSSKVEQPLEVEAGDANDPSKVHVV